MNAARDRAVPPRARRRWARIGAWTALAGAVLLLLAWLALGSAPAASLLLSRIGAATGLEIRARGGASLQLGALPGIVARDLEVREPGAAVALLQARRVVVTAPWRTVRGLGDRLDLTRIELDAPRVDLPALRAWLARRPPGVGRMPVVGRGLRADDGHIEGGDWRIESLRLSVPRLAPDAALRARASGRYVDAALHAPFSLAATLQRPESGRGFGLAGVVAPDAGSWRLPAWVALSGALHWEPTLQLLPARLGASGRLATATVDESFTLGAHGPLRAHDGAWTLLPAHLVLRGDGMVPRLHARGHAALGARLLLRLDGRLARWPDAWPALPPPLDDPGVPLALGLDYRGARDLSSPLALRAAREGVRFHGRLDVPALLAWNARRDSPLPHSPLPPLQGRLEAEAVEVSGARLRGVVIEFGDAP